MVCILNFELPSLPLPKKPCDALQQSWGTSESGRQVLPPVFPLITQLKAFSLLPSSDSTAPCSQIWILCLSHHLPPPLQGLEEGGCGTAGAGQPSHPILSWWEQRQSIYPALTGL